MLPRLYTGARSIAQSKMPRSRVLITFGGGMHGPMHSHTVFCLSARTTCARACALPRALRSLTKDWSSQVPPTPRAGGRGRPPFYVSMQHRTRAVRHVCLTECVERGGGVAEAGEAAPAEGVEPAAAAATAAAAGGSKPAAGAGGSKPAEGGGDSAEAQPAAGAGGVAAAGGDEAAPPASCAAAEPH